MAKPANPLDKYSIYTYHIALFMSDTHDKLLGDMDSFDWTTSTTRKSASKKVKSLILNSVTDPFQSIQELKISQIAPNVSSSSRVSPWGQFSMKIVEPGNCMFITKIHELMDNLKTRAFASALWGVKIKFVGRTPDSDIEETLDVGPAIGMLVDMRSNFTSAGSTYDLAFVMTDTAGIAQVPEHANSLQYGTLIEGAHCRASTLGEAITNLGKAAQNNYDEYVKTHYETTAKDMKKITYNFSIDDDPAAQEIASYPLKASNSNSPTDTSHYLTFNPGTTVPDAIMEIIMMCPKMLQIVGDSKDLWKKPFHIGAKIFQIRSYIEKNPTEDVVNFKITMYNGADSAPKPGKTIKVGTTEHSLYEFDFYFADNYNIDVLNFDMSANVGLLLYLGGTPRTTQEAYIRSNGDDTANTNSSGSEGGLIHTNERAEKEVPFPTIDIQTNGKSGDTLVLARNERERIGFPGGTSQHSKERTAALESLAKYCSIDSISKTLHIRGHSELLQRCLKRGDVFGTTQGVWLKLNIWSRDEDSGQKDKYFYDGAYWAIAMEHIFQEGKFTQELTLMMMDFEFLKEIGGK